MVWLLNVHAVFAIENGKDTLHSNVLKEFVDENVEYAILSHRWGDEVNHDEMSKLKTMTKEERDKVREHEGYGKILKSCKQAANDRLSWLWVDTCCIDKRSSSELSEAIRSMYRWYENSKRCYAYLHDVERRTFPTKQDKERYKNSNGWPELFSRGWTLQELIAPADVQFFNKEWISLGSKQKHASTLHEITRIPESVLKGTLSPGQVCVAQIMSWAADRQTTRVEDRAYSLLGLFGVNMPMLYGEGRKAFQRLQLEIIRVSNDQSIFAWDPNGRIRRTGLVLADDPSYFRDCHDVRVVRPDDFIIILRKRLHFDKRTIPPQWGPASAQQLHKYTVTNGGIEICLPLTPYRDFPTIHRATLACTQGEGALLTIDLESRGSNYYRSYGATNVSEEIPNFSDLYLACHRDPKCCNITLDEGTLRHYSFTRCGAFPPVINGDCVALSSLTIDLIVLVYSSAKVKARFAVGLGYYFDEQWVHVVCDDAGDSESWSEDYAKKVYAQLWNARIKLANPMPQEQHRLIWSPYRPETVCYIKHAHLPRSICAAKIIFGEWKQGYTTVTIDVGQCTGCCYGPLKWRTTVNATDCFPMSGLLKMDSAYRYGHWLLVDGTGVQFLECIAQKIELGDYGHWDHGSETFKCDGNIFDDLKLLPDTPGIDAANSAYREVERMVSNFHDGRDEMGDLIKTFTGLSSRPALALHRPIGLSLPTSQHLVLLLKALSTRLTGKYLVTTVVRCAAYYVADPNSEWTEKNESGECAPLESRLPSITALYDIAQPQVWRRDTADKERKELFKKIREQFYVLLNVHPPATVESGSDSAPGNEDIDAKNALEFFSNMFGVTYLRGYVGDVTFKEFVSILELQSSCEPLWTKTKNTPSPNSRNAADDEELQTAEELRIGAVVKQMLQVIRTDRPNIESSSREKIKQEAVSISKTLGFWVLKEFCDADARLHGGLQTHNKVDKAQCDVDHDCYTWISSDLQQINALQAKLDASNDEDEKRALEEDTTGKILWLCWRGLRQEVGQVPEKVIDHIARDQRVCYQVAKARGQALHEIIEIFQEALAEPVEDDQAHLRRIMADAEAGTSKYDLLHSVPFFKVIRN